MEAEKNKISTGTLTYEDIHNKAEYEAGSTGINIDTSKDIIACCKNAKIYFILRIIFTF